MPMHPSCLALAVVAVLGTNTCGSAGTVSTSTSAPDAATVSDAQQTFTRLYSSWNSRYPEATEQVLLNAAELAAAWRAIHGGDAQPAPAVDFTRQMVVLLAIGQRTTGGYTLRFDNIVRSAGATVVQYTVISPGPGCMATQVVSSPVELVAVPRAEAPYRFDKTLIVQRC